MTRALPCLLPALAALTALGCATAQPRPEGASASRACDYLPLQVGNRWVYDGPAQPGGAREKIEIAIDGTQGGFFRQVVAGTTHQDLVTCDSEGLRSDKRVLIPPDVKQGAKWTSVTSVGTAEKYEIVDVGSTYNAGDRSYANTLTTVVREPARDPQHPNAVLLNETTYAPNVGMVRIATRIQDGEKVIPQVELVLRSFSPAAKSPSP